MDKQRINDITTVCLPVCKILIINLFSFYKDLCKSLQMNRLRGM